MKIKRNLLFVLLALLSLAAIFFVVREAIRDGQTTQTIMNEK